MNVNGSRFHLLFGRHDWAGCLAAGPGGMTLGQLWDLDPENSDSPSFDEETAELRLAKRIAEIPDTPGEPRFTSADHRSATADRNGNLYWIADGRDQLIVQSVADQANSLFWPRQSARPTSRSNFIDYRDPDIEALLFHAVVVTADDYLLASFESGSQAALLRFDLVGGGAPECFSLPEGVSADDLAAARFGGAWLLDRTAKQLLLLDREMRLTSRPIVGSMPDFSPDGEEAVACRRAQPLALTTAGAPDATAIATLPDGSLLLLDAPATGPAGIFILEPDATLLSLLLRLDFVTFCFAVEGRDDHAQIVLGDPGGNRARRVRLEHNGKHWLAAAVADTLPLRRFGGRALVPIGGAVYYDSGSDPIWVRVMELPHRAFATEAVLVTPIFDSSEPQCLWDRVRLDACIPGGALVVLEARAADDGNFLEDSAHVGWTLQPAFYLSPAPSELPGKLTHSAPDRDRKAGKGCWEVLLQGIEGRFCQLRLKLTGDGRLGPHIRALRLWYPRFSYVERFLPAIYRFEAPAGSFLDRFLANFEGINTALEDRIATAETLFDPRSVPPELLDWFAAWFDMAIDARWTEERRRLFLANAAQYFAWRGTVRGLQLALKLALSDKVTQADFQLDGQPADPPGGIRIVESFRRMPNLRRFTPFVAGVPALPGARDLGSLWSPEEGSAGLWARFAVSGGKAPSSTEPFPLYDSGSPLWTTFAQVQFGFVPGAAARERARWQAFQRSRAIEKPANVPAAPPVDTDDSTWNDYVGLSSRERRLWQDFLSRRYRTIDRLQSAWAQEWKEFSVIPLPDHLPAAESAVRDWLVFEGQRLPMEAGAHRFSVLLPRARADVAPEAETDLLSRARHVVELEKPAHTHFDIRFYWAMNRIGEARIGLDTSIGQGSRAPELVPGAILGRAYVGAAFVGNSAGPSRGRRTLAC
jgi:phage tail-like protein